MAGIIRRSLLVNFRVDPDVMRRALPEPVRPQLVSGYAIAGICLIRLEEIRPSGVPACLGVSSENAAHRIAVHWDDAQGEQCGVYIPRRDTSSCLNALAGGRIFPGEHHRAVFTVHDEDGAVSLEMRSNDRSASIELRGRTSDRLPKESVFGDLRTASEFFRAGSLGFSATARGEHYDGIRLVSASWSVEPLAVEHVASSYFSDVSRFPAGSVHFDSALVMRDVEHHWVAASPLSAGGCCVAA
jgi:hypothetical protein